jgi:adenine-specific DNA glycosylase
MPLVMVDGQILLEQRPPTGIWGGLVSLPEIGGMQLADAAIHAGYSAVKTLCSAVCRGAGNPSCCRILSMCSPISDCIFFLSLQRAVAGMPASG